MSFIRFITSNVQDLNVVGSQRTLLLEKCCRLVEGRTIQQRLQTAAIAITMEYPYKLNQKKKSHFDRIPVP
jgi:hypothetical protein